MVYWISITAIIIFINYFSIVLSYSTADHCLPFCYPIIILLHLLLCTLFCTLHSASLLPVSPQKRAGLPGRSQQDKRPATTLTLWDKRKEEKSSQSRQIVRITHTLIFRSIPPKTKPTIYQICRGPVSNPCRIFVSLHEHFLADASPVLSWHLQPLYILFLLLLPGFLWSLSVGTGWKPSNWVFFLICRSLHLLPSASSGSLVDHHWTITFNTVGHHLKSFHWFLSA